MARTSPTAMIGPEIHSYFVDEAGDPTCFDRKGRILVGRPGVSNCFVVGAALIADPESLGGELTELRARLLADPYFAGVPSLSTSAGRTARLFHAKDDLPEVRREVFALLQRYDIEVYAAFRRKHLLAHQLRMAFQQTGRKPGAGYLYDELVTSIFKDRLHLADRYRITFARRGKATRNAALAEAIRRAKERFERRWHKGIDRPALITSRTPSETPGLQAVDYCLWALQRLLERREDRFYNYVASLFRLVIDRDDTRHRPWGEYYTARHPLTLDALMPVTQARFGEPEHTA